MFPDSYSNLPHSYTGPSATNQVMFGDYNFQLVDYEVFTVTDAVAPQGTPAPMSNNNNGGPAGNLNSN